MHYPQSEVEYCCTLLESECNQLKQSKERRGKESNGHKREVIQEPIELCKELGCDTVASEHETKYRKHSEVERLKNPTQSTSIDSSTLYHCNFPDHEQSSNKDVQGLDKAPDQLARMEFAKIHGPSFPRRISLIKKNGAYDDLSERRLSPRSKHRHFSHDGDQSMYQERTEPSSVSHTCHVSPSEDRQTTEKSPKRCIAPGAYPHHHNDSHHHSEQPNVTQFDAPMAIECPGGDICKGLEGKVLYHNDLAEKAIPNGLVIMSMSTNHPEQGFPFPKQIETVFSREEWEIVKAKLLRNKTYDIKNATDMGYNIEDVLDTAATLDLEFFRPAGLLMRLDCPGEIKYCPNDMELYNPANADDVSTIDAIALRVRQTNKRAKIERKEKRKQGEKPRRVTRKERKKQKEEITATVRNEHFKRRIFESLRLVLDPVSVLRNSEKATTHGWRQWQHQSSNAQRLATKITPPPKNNIPWDFSQLPQRRDRWPPSKHLYYDRFRGQTITVKSKELVAYRAGYQSIFNPIYTPIRPTQFNPQSKYLPTFAERELKQYFFVPDWDSMDQEGVEPRAVIGCDEVPFEILRRTWGDYEEQIAMGMDKTCLVM